MILTTENRVKCLMLMEVYGFTYDNLNKMKPAELDDWIDAHNAYVDLKELFEQEQEQGCESEYVCDCNGNCSHICCDEDDDEDKEDLIN